MKCCSVFNTPVNRAARLRTTLGRASAYHLEWDLRPLVCERSGRPHIARRDTLSPLSDRSDPRHSWLLTAKRWGGALHNTTGRLPPQSGFLASDVHETQQRLFFHHPV